ncbi:MAG: hypothetical protein Q8O07_04020, partial [Chloroflexota bacterium]|nr:hypothetical protein [Chloroflexota bacterium]
MASAMTPPPMKEMLSNTMLPVLSEIFRAQGAAGHQGRPYRPGVSVLSVSSVVTGLPIRGLPP